MTTDPPECTETLTRQPDMPPSDRNSASPGGVVVPNLFKKLAVASLLYTIFVVIFGAFVRAGLHGDGCGTSWPICNGQVVPLNAGLTTYVEFTHRVTSGLLLLGVMGMAFWARKLFPHANEIAQHKAIRQATAWTMIFVFVSAIIGAILVINSFVTQDKSLGRAITMPLHLVNTFLLIGAQGLLVFFTRGGSKPTFAGQGGTGTAIKVAMGGLFLLGMTGAISAMGKTAFAGELAVTNGLLDRVNMHVGESAHWILRGGVLHPLMAMSVGLLVVFCCRLVSERRPKAEVKYWSNMVLGLYVVQMVFGVANLVLSAPLWMQLVHLALALANWLSLVMLAAVALHRDYAVFTDDAEANARSLSAPKLGPMATVKAYIALTKPRVISLLLFTTVAAMFIATGTAPSLGLVLLVCLGGYMSAGAANTYNMVIERDLDVAMERTASRPTVTHAISNRAALTFATIMAVGSFAMLWIGAHPLAAWMALCGLLCYVFVYTLWLKRRTWHNIVIGGAAGAFPPLVGYAAVTGELSPLAWFLFALIFTWTPVHFWALALLIKDDYAKAGVPMLPVVKGEQVTVVQITLYAVITTLLCFLPVVQREAGLVYLLGSVILNAGLLAQSAALMRNTSREKARSLFKFSMVYLALIFVVIAVDRVWTA